MSQKTKILKAENKINSSRKPKIIKKKKDFSSMDDLLAQYTDKFRTFSVGNNVRGKVIEIAKGRVVLDIGGKSEGLVAEKAYKESEDYIKGLKIGDELDATVIVSENSEGYTILSFRHAKDKALWDQIEKDMESGTPIEVAGVSVNPSGVTVNIKGIYGFIPTSQLGKEILKNPQKLIDQKFAAVVIDFEKESKKIILSEKEVSEKEELKITRNAIKKVSQGEVYDGEVTSVFDFGCFVKILVKDPSSKDKVALEGLVHISELSWEKVNFPSDVVSPGDKVKVKIIGKKGDKLAFSIKQAIEDPWENIEKKYKRDAKIKGKIVKVSDFGVFVALEPGVEGLVHITKIPPGKNLNKGEEIDVYVEEIDAKEQKISLGLVLTEKPVGYK